MPTYWCSRDVMQQVEITPANHASDYREWLLMHAQMQLDYADWAKAITLLELVEAIYGDDVTTGLMLCRAWGKSGKLAQLKKRADYLLTMEMTNEQHAAIYYCLSEALWKSGDKSGSRRARRRYLALINPTTQKC